MKIVAVTLILFFAHSIGAELPSIGMDESEEYEISKLEKVKSADFDFIYICASSLAKTKKERAHTMVKVVMDSKAKYEGLRLQIDLAPHNDLCQLGRLIGQAYFSPKGLGWQGLSSRKWTWQILTTNFKVSDHEIKDTLIYETNKDRFKEEYGVMSFHEKLEEYVKQKIGHSPHYVTAGLWVDGFHKE